MTERPDTTAFSQHGITVHHGDCVDIMRDMKECSVDAIVTDPPYGLEFMGKEWDKFSGTSEHGWKTGSGGFSRPGIGDRPTQWTSFGMGTSGSFGGANPTCETCGGRLRGKKKCECETPEWRVKGSPVKEGLRKNNVGASVAYYHSMYDWLVEAFRVAKPGAFLLAFGGTRTFHRMACAIEDAGWEIRDTIMWVYGSGFPKSLDISKSIDKAAGAEREVVDRRRVIGGGTEHINRGNKDQGFRPGDYQKGENILDVTAPATDLAKQWSGYGTALKPAWEPIIVAMKPCDGTFAANAQKHGVAGMNIDGCRVEWDAKSKANDTKRRVTPRTDVTGGSFHAGGGKNEGYIGEAESPSGRWPANLIWSHHPECESIGTSEVSGNGHWPKSRPKNNTECGPNGHGGQDELNERFSTNETVENWRCHADCPSKCFPSSASCSSASRFFYCAKASQAERSGSKHPTVKPLNLIAYLVRLVRPPDGGVILDPFAGSGTTAEACIHEKIECIAIERDAEYINDIRSRISKPEFNQRGLW